MSERTVMKPKPKNAVRDLLDRQLGRVTMYRLIVIVLSLLVVVMLAFTIAGTFERYEVKDQLVTLVVLLVVTYVSSRLCGLVWRVKPHGESAVITALLLWFIFDPSSDTAHLLWLSLGSVLANLSKYVLAWRGRHIFNPAAAGAFLTFAIQYAIGRDLPVTASWWIGNERMLPFVAVGAFLVLWRTRRLDIGLLYMVVAVVLLFLGNNHLQPDANASDLLRTIAYTSPFVFLGGYMLSEPLTLPPRRIQQLAVAAATGVVFSYPIWIYLFVDTSPDLKVFNVTPGVALLVGNLVAFAFGRRRGVALDLVEKRQLTPQTHEFTFEPRRPVSFRPGQFAELTVPHKGADGRGSRRSFSISSPPDADGKVKFTMRVPEQASTFKRAMVDLEPGSTVHATGIGGDFVLPKDPATPVLLVAGGIGITPFISQLLHEPDRDAVIVYGVTGPAEIAYADELAAFKVVVVSPTAPDHLPSQWRHVQAPFLSVDLVATAVPDLDQRLAYVSGPPVMVNAVRAGLAKRCKRVRTDYFTGY